MKAVRVHGDLYNYSKVDYKNIRTKVEIICKKHGPFWQTPDNHLHNRGCRLCYDDRQRLTTEQFIEKAQKIHGIKYDYSKTFYKNECTKVEIICSKHGSFWQAASIHLCGSGCKTCGWQEKFLSQEVFIQKAIEIHGNKYDYSKSYYVYFNEKTEIICKKHGSFWQTPHSHLYGRGCPKCSHLISKPEIKWLDKQKVSIKYRQYKIKIGHRCFKVDGFDPTSNTIYEFLGDYFHGNPNKYKKNGINKRVKKTFGELYQKTMDRIKLFENHDFKVKYIWESDFKGFVK